jgi:hypothetical protein
MVGACDISADRVTLVIVNVPSLSARLRPRFFWPGCLDRHARADGVAYTLISGLPAALRRRFFCAGHSRCYARDIAPAMIS